MPAAEGSQVAAATVRGWLRQFSLRHWKKDVPAGLVLGVESVPDGLAAGLLAGVNPVSGLYAYMMGTIFGALTTSSTFMTVQATGAMAVVVSDVPSVQGDNADAHRALFTLTVLTGVIMLVLGIARLGWIVRWVPNAVLTGFVNAVAINIVLGQLDNLTGYDSVGINRVLRAVNTILHVGQWAWADVAVGVLTMVVVITLGRTRLGALGMVIAIIVGSAVGAIPALGVHRLNEITAVPGALPKPQLPAIGLIPSLLVPAVALAFVGLVQGAAISKSVANPDGNYPDASGDFRGQGIANIAAGLLRGMPVGGSMSATSIITNAGARSRIAQLVAGLTMIIVVLTLSGVVGYVAMPALAGLLIVVGLRSLKPTQIQMVWRTGILQATVMTATFVLTLLIPLQYAVLAGIAISIILHVARQANRVSLRRWTIADDGSVTESDVPTRLGQTEVVVLRPYGSLFFASAGTFEDQLPAIDEDSQYSVVIITLRGKEDLGSTFINVMINYASRLEAADCRLKISGISTDVRRQLDATGAGHLIGQRNLYPMTDRLTHSTVAAQHDAEQWIAGNEPDAADQSLADDQAERSWFGEFLHRGLDRFRHRS
ncbi:SulP family inorganic anion transporter [Microlunatus soli]|uniref:Sulfate permease, SulP family n=1 Tax=Microlunatus soli TaxID=630515 RepID=A0A1H1YYF0_9ACTN|nr:SulP family inorganic anion transporter [Microlunatus soli]SDT26367.1 sulfate permease, SulP family [Microlunatus soli]